MAIKVNKKKTVTVQEKPVEKEEVQTQWNVDLASALMKMTEVISQQWDMIKMMQEKMAKLEWDNKAIQWQVVSKEEVEATPVLNEDNVASYTREDSDWYSEIIYKVWKIMYETEQPKVTRWMPDAAPMMTTVEEARRVNWQTVYDTKYFDSEEQAKKYIEQLRQKGINLPWARILSCYI